MNLLTSKVIYFVWKKNIITYSLERESEREKSFRNKNPQQSRSHQKIYVFYVLDLIILQKTPITVKNCIVF